MKLRIRASDIKDWFQYRCDRKFIYATLPPEEREALPVDADQQPNILAKEGIRFEAATIQALIRREGTGAVLHPVGLSPMLTPEVTLAFLRQQRRECFAHQAHLRETQHLRFRLQLPDSVSIRHGLSDLLRLTEWESKPAIQIIDIKHTRQPTHYHRTQVAFYALMLRGMLQEAGETLLIHPQGQIWHIARESGQAWAEATFPLRGYEEMILDFFHRQIGTLSRTIVRPGRDESFFHLYFKCEQCSWLAHCSHAIGGQRPREAWDISAVPGMSQLTKRVLHKQGIKTLRTLTRTASLETSSGATWTLRTRGALLKSRAEALVEDRWWRLPEHHTWLMPPRIDVKFFLVIDRDPVAGRLVTLGCLITGAIQHEPVIEIIRNDKQELQAIHRVLGAITQILAKVHKTNERRGEDDGLRAHIFVYEASEANDLRNALARYLEDPSVRSGLLDLVRMFPPEEIRAPEPEYRGAHHLPASALRSVVESLYVLPAKVSYDLARVSRALTDAAPPLRTPYIPEEQFAHPFSARLSIDIARRLPTDSSLVVAIRTDLEARLRAMDALCDWILKDNVRTGDNFLRLRKPPFRFQAQFHPLDAVDLDVLIAQELLQSRAERLAVLVELARPAAERRERLRCYAHLTLRDVSSKGRQEILEFDIPPESRQADLAPGSLGIILTDDDPDLRLDPARWNDCSVAIAADQSPRDDRIRVQMPTKVYRRPSMQRLLRSTSDRGWFIDQAHVDINTGRMEHFLRFLAHGGA